ncbi:MAG: hypothetical protein JWR18_1600 [Segetibacter sp.]|jgi:hypothetical protein|nr:hypothetical protein [Segetibacter sp.]
MKQLFIVLSLISLTVSSFAQEEEEEKTHKFRRDNIFIGGAFGLGLSSGGFSAGVNPEIGYSITNWLDAGFSTNFNYNSYSAEYNNGYRQRSFNYGAGMFARVFPIKSVFLQVLPEYNRMNTTVKDMRASYPGDEVKYKQEAPSLLLGIGYASREVGRSSFYTVIMMDAGNNENSPYIGYMGTKQPILRTGFTFYLRPRKR